MPIHQTRRSRRVSRTPAGESSSSCLERKAAACLAVNQERSVDVRNVALHGASGNFQRKTTANTTADKPSQRNSQRQPENPKNPSILRIEAASRPPAIPAMAEAEERRAYDSPNSASLNHRLM
eukprot:scaffold287_cov337-Pavlova_lutheri.AAC.71